jgi:hypothetical protein
MLKYLCNAGSLILQCIWSFLQPITFETIAIDILHVLKDVIGEATFGGEKVLCTKYQNSP